MLEYVTAIHNFGEDAFPNADLRYYGPPDPSLDADDTNEGGAGDLPDELNVGYPPGGTTALLTAATPPTATDNDGDGMSGLVVPSTPDEARARYVESFLPAQGLINCLTANDGILKAAPLAAGAGGTINPATDGPAVALAAEALTAAVELEYPEGNPPVSDPTPEGTARGPYLLVDEPILGLTDLAGEFGGGAAANRRDSGDFTGLLPTATGTLADADYYDPVGASFEDATVDLARVSNLLTTRSDSYTVYVVVQAWDNFGGVDHDGDGDANPRMVRQKRVAFEVDRSGVYPKGHGISGLVGSGVAGEPTYDTLDESLEALDVTPLRVD